VNAVLQTDEPRLRPMRLDDLDEVMAIERAVYPFGWTEGIFADCLRVGYCCWVLEQEGHVIGYGVMSVAVGEAHILNIAIASANQRRGLGRRMVEHLLDLGTRLGAETAFLEVRPSNRPAVRLYEVIGFNQVGLRRDYYPAERGREDALIMARQLV